MLSNVWVARMVFYIGSRVKVVAPNSPFVGRVGEVTGMDVVNEWVGVHFGGAPKYIAGNSWNEFYPHELARVP